SPRASNGGPHPRVSSPAPRRSTLMTLAPRSPSIMVQSGPARTRVKSSTWSPASGKSLVTVVIVFRYCTLIVSYWLVPHHAESAAERQSQLPNALADRTGKSILTLANPARTAAPAHRSHRPLHSCS